MVAAEGENQRDGVALEEDNGFGGTVWSRSVEMAYKVEGDCILKTAPLAVGKGAAESYTVKKNREVVFVDVLRDRKRFTEIDRKNIDKVDKVEFRCRLSPWRDGRRDGRNYGS